MHLLEDLVDVDGIGLLPLSLPFLLVALGGLAGLQLAAFPEVLGGMVTGLFVQYN